ncbi:MAG TPA: CAP domain-containing protein [Polyangia bacterium]
MGRSGGRGSLLGALLGLLVGLFAGAKPAWADHVSPVGKGARKYFAPPPPVAVDALKDPLGRALHQLVNRLAQARGETPPQMDVRLEALAETLADTLGPDEVPGLELQEFLLSHFGLADPVPELAMFQVGLDDNGIAAKFAQSLPGTLRGGPFGRMGIGIKRAFFGKTSVVMAFQRMEVELMPVPRRLGPGDSALMMGRLLRARRNPQVMVGRPAGDVQPLPVRGEGENFSATFRCDAGSGRYQVEIMASGNDGKSVVANFPIYCGVEPPRSAPRNVVSAPETQDPTRAEELALKALQRDRVAHGLPMLTVDDRLAKAARGYSQELARRQVVEHVSRESGSAADRVKRVGAQAVMIAENVGRANSIGDVQRSFMSSPGHRANVLSRGVSRVGIGVAIRKDARGTPTLYVTQLFAR